MVIKSKNMELESNIAGDYETIKWKRISGKITAHVISVLKSLGDNDMKQSNLFRHFLTTRCATQSKHDEVLRGLVTGSLSNFTRWL